jgi:2-C-methyl-D-erythritol 4-phosphate cytidylyltransferase/2-C-methyl-D-erythritol 2,4-cyclodiphosphate synthase
MNTINRKGLFKSQTPQFFDYKILMDLIELPNYNEVSYTDEAELLEKNDILVNCIDGDIYNEKITNINDYNYLIENNNEELIFKKRQGIASDVHKLEIGRKLILGGIEIPSKLGLQGHSDADVVLHAISDSIFGACSKGDLGAYFPSSDMSIKNSSSKLFLNKALQFMRKLNLKIFNIDIQIILQVPKISVYIVEIEKNISKLLDLNLDCINLKVTSTDKLGLIGNGEGIATLSSVSLVKK